MQLIYTAVTIYVVMDYSLACLIVVIIETVNFGIKINL